MPRKITIQGKSDEIAIIEALASQDTYFADSVSLQDAEKMCRNIREDTPIFFGTLHDLEERTRMLHDIETLTKEVKDMSSQYEAKLQALQEQLTKTEGSLDLLIKRVLEYNHFQAPEATPLRFPSDEAFTDLRILSLKLRTSLPLDADEREYLARIMDIGPREHLLMILNSGTQAEKGGKG